MTSLDKARLYEKYRLPYAPELARELLSRTGSVGAVADIGAGTGQLARLFADCGAHVYAVEPDAAMRQVGAAALAALPAVEFVPGSAEQTTLPSQSLDLIVVGNAFHRFQPEACGEFRRILRTQGWLAVITYSFPQQPFADALFTRLAALPGVAERMDQAWHRLPIEAAFGGSPIHTVSYPQSLTEDWTAFFGSACAGLEAPEPGDPEFAQFEALNREAFDACAVDGRLQVVYETRVAFGQPEDC